MRIIQTSCGTSTVTIIVTIVKYIMLFLNNKITYRGVVLSTPTGERLVVEARVEHVLPVGAQVDISFNFATGFFFDFEIERRLC
jgi:hypothetical protein